MPSFDRVRKTSQGGFKPSLSAIKTRSRGDVEGANDVRKPHYVKYSENSVAPGYKSGSNDVVSTKTIFCVRLIRVTITQFLDIILWVDRFCFVVI